METVTIRIGGQTEFQKADELIRQAQEAEQARESASAKGATEKPIGQVKLSSARRTGQHRQATSRAVTKIKVARAPKAVLSGREAGIGDGIGIKEKATVRKSSARSRALVTTPSQNDGP